MKRLIQLHVNGQTHDLVVHPARTLLDVLRDQLGLTGAKRGCGLGACGACTVLLDGRPAAACLTLALEAADQEVLTIEGLAEGGTLHPVQEAFVESGAVQCGFCTPGMVLSAKTLLDRCPDPKPQEIREALAGNVCRCTGYVKIIEAVSIAARRMREAAGGN
ncbi:MAG: (2Fe-2S)-binding protein [Betaproteobacteria bacterium]|nr:(2Fe-2S)-binding protein [Betaproteobacteria bacterium]